MKIILLNVFILLSSCSSKSWREASRESIGIAPKASELKEDIVQIYYARAFAWRGAFGVHPWIAWKSIDDQQYTVAQVTAWNIRRQGTAVRVEQDLPDRKWFDSTPELMFEARGEKASKIISQLNKLIKEYPFKDNYRVWPGPNSNTFVSYLIRNIDELNIELPATAIGKDYFGATNFVSNTASNTGFTLSALGVLGFTLGLHEGVEINLFGLHFGLDLWTPALKLPFIGRLGFKDI
tara:strand:- start:226590 stop:227300 length:711 start_codon:yes stop_codon:yes gene_type:complete